MESILVIFHIIICLLLIAIVLLQTGRGAEIGAAFGGASRTLFGATGATTVMGKVTTVVAILFMATCLALTYYSGRPVTKSIMDKPAQKVPATPAIPEAKPVQAGLPATNNPANSADAGQSGAKNVATGEETKKPSEPQKAGIPASQKQGTQPSGTNSTTKK